MSALLQGAPRADNGGVFVSNDTIAPDRVRSGIPYDVSGAVAVDFSSPASYMHQGLAFTANGRLVAKVAASVDYFGSGSAPFQEPSSLAVDTIGPAHHHAHGVPYVANGRLFVGTGTSSTHTMYVQDFGGGAYGYTSP